MSFASGDNDIAGSGELWWECNFVVLMMLVMTKSRYYKEGIVQSKKCQAIRW